MRDSTSQREIIINGETVTVTFIKRPFREGIEAKVTLGDRTVTIAELGLGEQALIETIRGEIGGGED
jgi:hypothetical protein